MANRPWLEAVRTRLVEKGMPSAYIRRFTEELADHFEDLLEESMRKEASVLSRLGEPDHVADAAVAAYQQRGLFGRHPWAKLWVFGISPVAAMLSLFVLACLGVAAVGEICKTCEIPFGDRDHLGAVSSATLGWWLSLITTIVPAALLTIVYCKVAQRFHVGRKWMLASCIALASIALLPFQCISLSDMPGKSLWTIGLGLPPSFVQCVQMAVPLLVGLWWMRRTSRREPPARFVETLQNAY